MSFWNVVTVQSPIADIDSLGTWSSSATVHSVTCKTTHSPTTAFSTTAHNVHVNTAIVAKKGHRVGTGHCTWQGLGYIWPYTELSQGAEDVYIKIDS